MSGVAGASHIALCPCTQPGAEWGCSRAGSTVSRAYESTAAHPAPRPAGRLGVADDILIMVRLAKRLVDWLFGADRIEWPKLVGVPRRLLAGESAVSRIIRPAGSNLDSLS